MKDMMDIFVLGRAFISSILRGTDPPPATIGAKPKGISTKSPLHRTARNISLGENSHMAVEV